jgi:hypothetical protein
MGPKNLVSKARSAHHNNDWLTRCRVLREIDPSWLTYIHATTTTTTCVRTL